jgi:hypothetical protein
MASDLDQLIEMGFDKERSQIAVTKTGGCKFTPFDVPVNRSLTNETVQGALQWLEDNQDKSLEEIQAQAEAQEEDGPALQPGEAPRSLVCNDCGKKFRSTAQAEFHASKSQHVDFSESTEEIAPLTEQQKKERLAELREKLAAKRAGQSEQDKIDKKNNEVCLLVFFFVSLACKWGCLLTWFPRKSDRRAPKRARTLRRSSNGNK